MAGFAINVELVLKNREAVFGVSKDGEVVRQLEAAFVEQFTTKETVECLGQKEVMFYECLSVKRCLIMICRASLLTILPCMKAQTNANTEN